MHSLVYNLFVIIYTHNTNIRNQLKSKIYEYEILFLFHNNAMGHNIKVQICIMIHQLLCMCTHKFPVEQNIYLSIISRIEGIYV